MKSLETFEFRAIPSVNKRLVLELTRSEYLDRRENVLALGNSGTGKTHLALALGLAACQKGYRVRFTTAAALVNELLEARDDKRLLRVQKQLAKQDLLIVDELGYVPLSKTGADLPPGADPCGENGEFHTFVCDGPIFRWPIVVSRGVVVERDNFVFCDLVPKSGADETRRRPRA